MTFLFLFYFILFLFFVANRRLFVGAGFQEKRGGKPHNFSFPKADSAHFKRLLRSPRSSLGRRIRERADDLQKDEMRVWSAAWGAPERAIKAESQTRVVRNEPAVLCFLFTENIYHVLSEDRPSITRHVTGCPSTLFSNVVGRGILLPSSYFAQSLELPSTEYFVILCWEGLAGFSIGVPCIPRQCPAS